MRTVIKGIAAAAFLSFTCLAFAKTVDITIVNYLPKPLAYIKPGPTLNSQLDLPSSVSAGSQAVGSSATGSVTVVDDNEDVASGTFKIGYDSHHYCEFRYSLEKQGAGWSWFMRPFRWVGMDHLSCSVAAEGYKIIAFQILK